jgi:23S rRNA (adenine-N6)-dimethyltransferase
MRNLRRKLLSQNFLHNRKLVNRLVGTSSIGNNDLVLEIGPGKGIITESLLSKAAHVIAVELDGYCYNFLLKEFASETNLSLYRGDFMTHPLPRLDYKVFANLPFAIEGRIIRRLIEAPNPPQDCYLVVMSDLANRLLARKSPNMFSALHTPWFDFEIVHRFMEKDFMPVPSVKAVLFRFVQKANPLLPVVERKKYQNFIKLAYGDGQSVRKNLSKKYELTILDGVLHSFSLSRKIMSSQLNLDQWVKLYKSLV